mmetsp:Transcript_52420/g.71563  ORF Transcript_52420/g.71563 Transcript_52420/m.71563 type:complete len:391 (-) Transcript_52420:77-1249(-)|eukprot:CAMPEP_0185752796 /NCGR_PEP_ID=MMETSP1174-20130828/11573_1 /TAXON_ID=35687 /ORGANISM="Dictyocha speculum, Strain CCMP1381" /LENGTH=390 /DNA_ID=CAMNT_0028430379 /DNA_START=24 /DNA_END=1196 /DNA_ORIENTATION=+
MYRATIVAIVLFLVQKQTNGEGGPARVCEAFRDGFESGSKITLDEAERKLPNLKTVTLKGDMIGHTFVILGGLHGSGTSITEKLVSSQSWASGFQNTGKPQDEGVFLSEAAPAGVGGPYFQCTNKAFISEVSPGPFALTRDRQTQLCGDWSKHWDLSAPVLVEKTPTHVVQARWYQAVLGGYQSTRFIMVMRHPAKTWKHGEYLFQVQGFISAHEALERDVAMLGNIVIFQYERFFESRDAIFRQISRLVNGREIVYRVAGENELQSAQYGVARDGNRKLIGLHGSRKTPELSPPTVKVEHDANLHNRVTDAVGHFDQKSRLLYARRLARFGYDLSDHRILLVNATPYWPHTEQITPGLFVKVTSETKGRTADSSADDAVKPKKSFFSWH